MSNDGWEDVTGGDGWEDVPEKPGKIKQAAKNALGGLDAALTMGAQIVPFIGSGVAAAGALPFVGPDRAEELRKSLLESGLGLGKVAPVTQEGEQIFEAFGEFSDKIKNESGEAAQVAKIGPFGTPSDARGNLQRLGSDVALGLWGSFAPVPGAKGVRKLGNKVEKIIERKPKQEATPSPADVVIAEETGKPALSPEEQALKDKVMKRAPKPYRPQPMESVARDLAPDVFKGEGPNVSPILAGVADRITNYVETTPAMRRADDSIAGRQMELTDPVALEAQARALELKRREHFEQEAAFRRQADAAPVLPNHGMDNPDLGTGLPPGNLSERPAIPGTEPPIVRNPDVWYADPQGQIFKGDPASELAKLALERQTEAFEKEFTHLQGKGTPEGEPLRPLQDVERKLGIIDRAIESLQEQVDAAKVRPKRSINAGKRKQAGAIDLGLQEALAKTALKALQVLKQLKSSLTHTEAGTGLTASVIPEELRKPKTVVTPAQLEQKKQQQKFINRQSPLRKALSEFDVIRSKEEALALAAEAKDISGNFAGKKNLAPDINFHAVMSDNPILKYARTLLRDARTYADNFSQVYLSNKKTGLTPLWTKLDKKQRVAVIDALMAGDKHRVEVTDSMMAKLGFNEAQRQFVKTFYEANKRMWDDWVKELETLGLKVPEYRTGHFPGLFVGAYKTLVMDGKKVLGVISTDTVAQTKVAKKYIQEQMGNKVQFLDQKRRGMEAGPGRFTSDAFSGVDDVLKLLAEKDPAWADAKEMFDDAIKAANNKLFNFNVHELHKKGVFGNEGNRPWLSAERNADDAFKALVRYFEEGTMHHAVQVPHKLLSDVVKAPEVQHMPNATNVVKDYMAVMMNRQISDFGSLINGLLDMPFKYLTPSVSWGKNGHVSAAFGVGPHAPLKISGELKNTMSQMFMGFGNYMFTAAQMVQPVQTGLPFVQLAATRLGLSPLESTAALGKGGTQFMRAFMEEQFGKDFGVEPHMKEAYQYAKDRGMLTFSELERAYQGTQSKVGRMKDEIAEANMKFGEWSTRTPMFMSFVELLHKAGMETKDALPIAENITQFSMIDYHKWARPLVYQKLGVIGGFMSGLTTFKHGVIGQQAYLAKQAINPTGKHSRQVVPAAASLTTMLALAGITGSPFYDELDSMVKFLTNKFGNKQQSIRELVLNNLPEWANSGLISNATNLNMQGKFSSADMIPDNMFRAISPHLEAAWRILDSAYEMIKNQDAQGVRNFATNGVPSGWKRAMEAAVSKDKDGNLIGKDGLPVRYRTPEEWERGAVTGLRSQEEAIERDKLWSDRQRYKADVDRLKEISKEYKRRVINDNLTNNARSKLIDEYMARGGDPKELVDLEKSAQREKAFTEKERLQGIPKTLRSIHRFQNYQ